MTWIGVFLAYLLGSIPTGLILGKCCYGIDLRREGSCNIGATNAYRVLGTKAATIVFLIDFFKGFCAVWLGQPDIQFMILGGMAAIVGHMASVFMGFKGGRGVATGLGVFACMSPVAALMAVAVWGLVLAYKKIVSLASIIAAIFVPLFAWTNGADIRIIGFAGVGAFIVIVKHTDNIKRLIRGEEKRITNKRE